MQSFVTMNFFRQQAEEITLLREEAFGGGDDHHHYMTPLQQKSSPFDFIPHHYHAFIITFCSSSFDHLFYDAVCSYLAYLAFNITIMDYSHNGRPLSFFLPSPPRIKVKLTS